MNSFDTFKNQVTYKLFNSKLHIYKHDLEVLNGVMVIVAGIGHGDTSSNPGLIAFHIALIPLGKV